MGLLDKLPKVPRLEKFCFCMDVPTGVKLSSIGLMVLWALYFLGAFLGLIGLGGKGTTGNWVWAVIWSIANIVVYGAVVFGMMKTKKILLLPALIVSVFDVVVGALNCIINFVSLSWFAAIWIGMIAGITAYYAIGLKNVYDDMSDAPAAAEPSTEAKPPVNPV